MDDKEFKLLKQMVCSKLERLDSKLTYHNLVHTIDVLEQSERIARQEGINENDIWLLKVAALYHDTGFLRTYRNHEEISCSIFFEDSLVFNFSREEQEKIVGLILATKVPQRPLSHLEKIICDADLDYLGRDDFFTISNELRKEFMVFGVIKNDEEWDKLQINFLTKHQYHTETSRREKEAPKQLNIKQLP